MAWSSSADRTSIAKRRHEQPLDQIGGQSAAAAVAQQNVLVIGQRHGTAQPIEIDDFRHWLISSFVGDSR